MRKTCFLLAIAMLALISCDKEKANETSKVIPAPSFAKGADISWVSEMESNGKTFAKKDGTKADILEVLTDVGINAIRLRVWVDPQGGWSAKDDVVKLAKRVQKAGLPLMVDFHYSDFFADPSRQTVPSAWKGDTSDLDKMADHVREHTTDVLTAIKEAGITPAWVQIGNETHNGMIWPCGQLWGNGAVGWSGFAKLYNAGYYAAKAVFPNIIAMPHLNNAYADNDWFFKEMKSRGCPFDMIALSHYPQSESKMTASEYNTAAVNNIKTLYATYQVKIMVSEIGVKTPNNEAIAKTVLQEFMTAVKGLSACAGVFYWEPEVYDWWKPSVYTSMGWNAYDMGAFLSGGKPSSVMDCFKD